MHNTIYFIMIYSFLYIFRFDLLFSWDFLLYVHEECWSVIFLSYNVVFCNGEFIEWVGKYSSLFNTKRAWCYLFRKCLREFPKEAIQFLSLVEGVCMWNLFTTNSGYFFFLVNFGSLCLSRNLSSLFKFIYGTYYLFHRNRVICNIFLFLF